MAAAGEKGTEPATDESARSGDCDPERALAREPCVSGEIPREQRVAIRQQPLDPTSQQPSAGGCA
jgi:hypothetical protein